MKTLNSAGLGPRLTPELLGRLDRLRLRCCRPTWGTYPGGRFTVNRRGSSIEFAEYMPYAWGDDFRAIDWNLFGRLDRLFVKTFKEEIELTVHLLVDATASMAHPAEDAKFAYARDLATALAYVALGSHHLVRIATIGGSHPQDREATPLVQHRRAIFGLREFLETVTPTGQVTLSAWMDRYVHAHKVRGGAAIILSDWMVAPRDWMRAIALLRYRNVEAVGIQVLGAREERPHETWRRRVVVDAETGERRSLAAGLAVKAAFDHHNEQLRQHCRRQGMPWVQVITATPLQEFLLRILPRMGMLASPTA